MNKACIFVVLYKWLQYINKGYIVYKKYQDFK